MNKIFLLLLCIIAVACGCNKVEKANNSISTPKKQAFNTLPYTPNYGLIYITAERYGDGDHAKVYELEANFHRTTAEAAATTKPVTMGMIQVGSLSLNLNTHYTKPGYDYRVDQNLANPTDTPKFQNIFGHSTTFIIPGNAPAGMAGWTTTQTMPKEIMINISPCKRGISRSGPATIHWNADPTSRNNNVHVMIDYNTLESHKRNSSLPVTPIRFQYDVPDIGTYVFSSTDMAVFTVGMQVTISVMRGDYWFITAPDTKQYRIIASSSAYHDDFITP